jgi:acetyltransferase
VSIRNLDALLEPRSVALVGASDVPGSVGHVLARNLLHSGFAGSVALVNPRHRTIEGVRVHADVASLPEAPDLAVIATPPLSVPGLVAALGARGTRAAVVISAGFAEASGGGGPALQQALLDAARPHLLRVVGPNCIGLLVPRLGLNASFAPLAPAAGGIAFVAQSGAVATSVLDWAHARGIGFSQVVSLGDMADVDFGDLLDWLALDPHTRAILLYVEAVRGGRKFLSAGRAAARSKPVLVVKGGRREAGARAARSHTGALAGADAVYDAAFRRAGMLRVLELEELFAAVETLALAPKPRGDRLAIVTNGGGLGVLAVDALAEGGGRLAELAPATLARLDAALPPWWSHGNPVDLIGDADPGRWRAALGAVLDDPGVDATLAIHCPTGVASPLESARAVAELAAARADLPLLTSWLGGTGADAARRLFAERGVPSYATPELAVRAFLQLRAWRRGQEILMETPPSIPEHFAPDAARARGIVRAALEAGREWLDAVEVSELLGAYGFPVASPRAAADPEHAAEIAAALGGPVALKVRSPDVLHKSNVGGVSLDVPPAAVRAEAEALAARVARARPGARLEGFLVQPMVHRAGAFELILGAATDPVFGPVVLFGQGGTAAERIDDRALALPPLNLRLARELVERTRIGRLLPGWDGRPGADLAAIELALVRLGQLLADVPEIAELDLNPLLADADGVLVLDARLRAARYAGAPERRLAIRPYPKELEDLVITRDGRALRLRPIRPEDEPALAASFSKLTREEIRLRFFVPLKSLSHAIAARLTQLDYDREMALVLTEPEPAGGVEIYGAVHLFADPDLERAEYAILVRHDWTGRGLGRLLMQRLIDYARGRGIREVWGDVLADNVAMRCLCRELGFREAGAADPGVVRVSLALRPEADGGSPAARP